MPNSSDVQLECPKHGAAPYLLISDEAYAANRVDDQAFEIELRRRFEALPDFLKREGVRMELASVVWLLSQPKPIIELLPDNHSRREENANGMGLQMSGL